MNVNWVKCEGDNWCGLDSVNLSHEHFDGMEGVYIIWHGGDNPTTVRVGQGNIADRLYDHRDDPDVQAYSHLGLYVTWASVPSQHHDGVELYLANSLLPLVGEHFPEADPIEVNLPW